MERTHCVNYWQARCLLHRNSVPVSKPLHGPWWSKHTCLQLVSLAHRSLVSFRSFTRINLVSLETGWELAQKHLWKYSEELEVISNYIVLYQESTWNWELTSVKNVVRRGKKCAWWFFPSSWTIYFVQFSVKRAGFQPFPAICSGQVLVFHSYRFGQDDLKPCEMPFPLLRLDLKRQQSQETAP